jgi:hypothetical protein
MIQIKVPSFARLSALLGLALALTVSSAGCGEEEKASGPATSFCTDGQKVCKGNYVATCASAGTAYTVEFCGSGAYCKAGKCEPTVCPKGNVKCSDDKKSVLQCAADGSSDYSKVATCKSNEACQDGVCIRKTCNEGEAWCGATTLFLCSNGLKQETICGSDQICSVSDKKCVARTCEPDKAVCKDSKTSQLCSASGSAWQDVACPSGQGCFDGICHPVIASGKDAGSTDATVGEVSDGVVIGTGDVLIKPPKDIVTELPNIFKVTFSKTKTPGAGDPEIVFDFPSAIYLPTLQMLQISGDKDLYKLEIQIAKVEEFATGLFTTLEGQAADTLVQINDGTQPQGVDWVWGSTDYEIEITEFGDSGGRIKGTINCEMVNLLDKKTKAWLVGGEFDIGRP